MSETLLSVLATAEISSLPDLIEVDGEVRALDTVIAERLGYERPRAIRDLIKRHRDTLEALGNLPCRAAKSEGRGRPSAAFYLSEAQTCFIVAKSDTTRANIELAHVVGVFTEYHRGNLIAKDAETQARLDAAEAARQQRIAEMRDDKEARRRAFKIMGSGSGRSSAWKARKRIGTR